MELSQNALDKTILLVEDNNQQRTSTIDYLNKNGIHKILLADRGEEVLLKVQSNKINLILMDIHLKGILNGVETMKLLKRAKPIPVIYTTGVTDRVTISEAIDTNPVAILGKPFHYHNLLNAINMSFSRSKKPISEIVPGLLEPFFDWLGTGFCITNSQGFFIHVNDEYCRIFQGKKEDFIGNNFTIILPDEQKESALKEHDQFIDTGDEDGLIKRREVKDLKGNLLNIKTTAYRYLDETGYPFKITTVVKLNNNDKNEADRLVNVRNRELLHRIKNNLSTLHNLMYHDLSSLPQNSDAYKIVSKAMDRIVSLSELYNIMDPDQVAGKAMVSSEIYINNLLTNMDKSLSISEKVRIYPEVDPGIKLTIEELTSLGMILSELITNSMKCAFDETILNPEIIIRLIPHDSNLKLEYRDNGKGIKRDQHIKRGNAMGFQIISALTQQAGGKLFQPEVSTGFTIRIIFPINKQPLETLQKTSG
ncbi:MAG TPA: response regulator [Cyclobacteriaceae bacterium]